MSSALLEVRHLKKHFPLRGGLLRRRVGAVKAVDDVSFEVERGRTLGLVGESGCGKSTLGRAVLRLHEPTAGEIVLDGAPITGLGPRELTRRRREMQIIFQDPYGSLNPRRTVLETLREPLDLHGIGTRSDRRRRVEELLELVGLRAQVLSRYPHEFSGGQRQRIGIARALALDPKLVIADEAVSALDVSVQAQVLNLIADLQSRLGLSLLFISHDLAVVQHLSHDVAVMYLGKIVESGPAERVYADPKHPYTRALLSAVPVPDPLAKSQRIVLPGDVPSPANPPAGCPFHTRCPVVRPECREAVPPVVTIRERASPGAHGGVPASGDHGKGAPMPMSKGGPSGSIKGGVAGSIKGGGTGSEDSLAAAARHGAAPARGGPAEVAATFADVNGRVAGPGPRSATVGTPRRGVSPREPAALAREPAASPRRPTRSNAPHRVACHLYP